MDLIVKVTIILVNTLALKLQTAWEELLLDINIEREAQYYVNQFETGT